MSETKIRFDDLSPILKIGVILSFGTGGFFLLWLILIIITTIIYTGG